MLYKKQTKVEQFVSTMLFSAKDYHLDYVQLTFSFPTLSKSYQKSRRYIQSYEHKPLKAFIYALCDNKNFKSHIGLISLRLNQLVDSNKFNNNHLWSYNRDSIMVLPDTRFFNIKIHLKGSFFTEPTLKRDQTQLLIVVNEIKKIILDLIKEYSNQYTYENQEKWYNPLIDKLLPKDMKAIENPLFFLSKVDYTDFYMNRFDLCRNDYISGQLQNYKEHYNQKKTEGKFQNLYTRDIYDPRKKIIWNVSAVTTGSLKFKAYLKNYDEPKRQVHSQVRFGKSKYIRREWKFYSERIRAYGIVYFSDFLSMLKNKQALSEVIKRMRRSYDITTPQDSAKYQAYHRFDYEPFIKKIARLESLDTLELQNEIKKQLKITLRKTKKTDWNKDQIKGSSYNYNPIPHIESLLKNYGRTLKTSSLLKMKEDLDQLIKEKEGFPKDCQEIDFWNSKDEKRKTKKYL